MGLRTRLDAQRPDIVYKRLVCRAYVKGLPAIVTPRLAVVDTGAPFSIVPRALWQDNDFVRLEPGTSELQAIRGLSGGQLPCRFGRVSVMLADTGPTFSAWFDLPAKLADADTMPLILGVAGFLDRFEVVLNRNGMSYITVPGPAFPLGSPP
ncbi:MAG: hypothetical protein FJ290_23615 [Planctomycetes bacterium]|nr:hypothetical protein [Planctomycetota bacterium]